jgi:tripartite-type tricarboxylate transporter receptor subunit TctC
MHMILGWLATLLACVAFTAPSQAQAQGYPGRPVKLVVPYPPGAGVDSIGRLVAERLAERWGQPVVVENRAGASGLVGAEFVARSPADGHTLLVMPLDIAINPALLDASRYDPVKNLVAIASLVNSTQILATSADSGFKTFADVARRSRAEPGKVSFGSCGNGSPGQIVGLLLKTEAATDLLHVPYKGCAGAVMDAVGGQVPLVIGGAGGITPQLKSGRLRALAVASANRDPLLPDVPTLKELGYPVSFLQWFALFAPAGTSKDIIARIHAELGRMYADPVFSRKLADQNLSPELKSNADFQALMTSDVDKYKKLLRQAGVTPD